MQALSIKNKNIYQRINKIVPLFNYNKCEIYLNYFKGVVLQCTKLIQKRLNL